MSNKDEDSLTDAFRGIKPLRQDRVLLKPVRKGPTESQIARRRAALGSHRPDANFLSTDHVDMLQPGDWLSYKMPGVQEGVFRQLRLGHYPVDASLDLHRRTVAEAREDVWSFIRECLRREARVLLVTHGKGHHSKTPAILKSHVNKWLRQLPDILAFHTAQPRHGGTGAVYVLLRKGQQQKSENRERHS